MNWHGYILPFFLFHIILLYITSSTVIFLVRGYSSRYYVLLLEYSSLTSLFFNLTITNKKERTEYYQRFIN